MRVEIKGTGRGREEEAEEVEEDHPLSITGLGVVDVAILGEFSVLKRVDDSPCKF
jgi:hypothetical protein